MLRTHHLLFNGASSPPTTLSGDQLQQRLEAFRLRNRGSRQRARECRRAPSSSVRVDGGRSGAPTRASSPVVESPAIPLLLLQDEEWGEAAIDLSTLMVGSEFEEFLVDGGGDSVDPVPVVTQPAAEEHNVSPDSLAVVPWTAPPAEDDILPGGVPVADFAATVSGWQPLSVVDSVLRARQTWRVQEEDIPRLRLAVQLVMAARQTALFDILDTMSVSLDEDQSVSNAFHQLVAFLINSVVLPN